MQCNFIRVYKVKLKLRVSASKVKVINAHDRESSPGVRKNASDAARAELNEGLFQRKKVTRLKVSRATVTLFINGFL